MLLHLIILMDSICSTRVLLRPVQGAYWILLILLILICKLSQTDGNGKQPAPRGKNENVPETGGISFSVYLDHDVQLGAHQTIKFNQVIINDGNGYSPHSGVFTCPEDGVYMLSFFIGQRSEHGVSSSQAELIVNSNNVIDAAADAFHATQDLQGGNTVVKRLKQGDLVWADSRNSGDHAEGSSGFRLTSFSGVYLYP